MKAKDRIGALLESLMRLYSTIAHLRWRQRLQHHHDGRRSAPAVDIAAQLSEHIGRLAEAGGATSTRDILPANGGPASTPVSTGTEPDQRDRGRLAKHLAATRAGSLGPELSAELKKRTWEHIHAALRAARRGDTATARLHARLAEDAFAEARHFMSGEAVAEFADTLKRKLQQLSGQMR